MTFVGENNEPVSQPKKRGRPPKSKGSRSCSQATIAKRRHDDYKTNSQAKLVEKNAGFNENDICSLSIESLSVTSDHSSEFVPQAMVHKRKMMPPPCATTMPSPVPKKKSLISDETLHMPEQSNSNYVAPKDCNTCDQIFTEESTSDGESTVLSDGENEGMRLDYDIQLTKPTVPCDAEESPPDNDNGPLLHAEDDDTDQEFPRYDPGVDFKDANVWRPHDIYRCDVEMTAYMTAMSKYAVEDTGNWSGGIGILDSLLYSIHNFEDTDAKNYMRGYSENPDLILHPAYYSSGPNAIGHWYLITYDTKKCEVSIYDSLAQCIDKPHSEYMEYCHRVSAYLQQYGYLDAYPTYVHPTSGSFNTQQDGHSCGVHVVRIAEEIAFTGSSHALFPFNIADETERVLSILQQLQEKGLPSKWKETCQSRAFELPTIMDSTPVKTLAPPEESKQKKRKKNKAKVQQENTVDLKTDQAPTLRRSTRLATKRSTKKTNERVHKRIQKRIESKAKKMGIAVGRLSANVLPPQISFGDMSKICEFCGGMLFELETSNRCCCFGTIPPQPRQRCPGSLQRLFSKPEFWKNVRLLNSMFAMVAVSCDLRNQMDIFVVSGEFKYRIGDILPQGDSLPRFQQNYLLDTDAAVTNRLNDAAKAGLNPLKYCDRKLVDRLEAVLREHHPLPREYKYAAEVYREGAAKAKAEGKEPERVYLVWQSRPPTDGTHSGCYNAPAITNSVFKVWKSSDGTAPEKSLMISVLRDDGRPRSIPFYDARIDPAAYPLMFIYGQEGWKPGMPKQMPDSTQKNNQKNKKCRASNQQIPQSHPTNDSISTDPEANIDDDKETPKSQGKGDNITTNTDRTDSEDYDAEYRERKPAQNPNPPIKRPSRCNIEKPPPSPLPDGSEIDADVSDCDSEKHRGNPYISMRNFHMSRTYDRDEHEHYEFHHITGMRKLSQVYTIDVYLRIERQKLDKHIKVQELLEQRADRCKTLRKTLERMKNKNPKWAKMRLGRVILLSHRYRGGPADMRRRYRNGVAINVRVGKGKSDLFITFTGNPMWPEIQNNLRTHYNPPEKWTDRPDLVNRVFILYAKAFLYDILIRGVLGRVVAYNYSVEHQKRGMPHIHLLAILHPADRKLLETAQGLDDLISAEIPENPPPDNTEETERKRAYFQHVSTKYVHHPSKCKQFCGMKRKQLNICNKNYPKDFSEVTLPDGNGYVEMKRPENGRFVPNKEKKKATEDPIKLTNQYIVPHNRYLTLRYGCHINVECVRNVRSIKYIYKYSFKGHDRGFVKALRALGNGLEPDTVDYNEVEMFRSTRVMGAAEADLRMRTGLPITKCSHSVEVLPVHLPAEHDVRFFENTSFDELKKLTVEDGVDEDSRGVSHLTAFFDTVRQEASDPLYAKDPTRAWNLRYVAMPEHYRWMPKTKTWQRRIVNRKVIGRVDTVYPSNREKFSLRELLHFRKGPKSFADLRNVNGIEYETFEQAAYAMGLFVDDNFFERTMKEVISVLMPDKCRLTFALLMVFNRPKDPLSLWNSLKTDLIDRNPTSVSSHDRERRALANIASILHNHGITMSDVTLPSVTDEELAHAIANDYNDPEYNTDADGMIAYEMLNSEQLAFVDCVIGAVNDAAEDKRLFFLQGSGGTGKTFVYNTIIRRLRHQGKQVLTVASTGVAAILLHGGQTVHSAFNLPIDVEEMRTQSAQNKKALIATSADILIWDEAPMQHHIIMRTVDNMLRDFTGNRSTPFGGKVVVMGGDFKQVLPVVPGGTVHDAYTASLLCCPIFVDHFYVHTLTINMRALKDPEYAEWLQLVGTGEDRTYDVRPNREGQIVLCLPNEIVERSKRKVMSFVYPDEIFAMTCPIDQYISAVEKSAIVAPKNAMVDAYNSLLISKLPNKARHYAATNWLYRTVNSEEDRLRPIMPTEVMIAFEKAGFAVQNLVLKTRSVVMLTRNLCVSTGLCNGTRMIVLDMKEEIIVCRVITGPLAGSDVAITRIEHVHDDNKDDAFPPFVRLQFPLRPAFAVSINKSQGQTLSRVGIMLDTQCFAHGQLYVALSRAGSSKDVRVYVPQGDFVKDGSKWKAVAKNVVHREVLHAVEGSMKRLTLP